MHATSLPRRGRRGTPRKPLPTSTRWVAAAIITPLATLSACGGDSSADESATSSGDSAYCSALADAKTHFVVLQEGDVEKFDEAFAGLHALAAESPASISQDWQAFDGSLVSLEDALADIGLEVSDLGTISAGEIPKGADAGDLARVPDLMLEHLGSEFTTSATGIERHAIEECDIELAV
jgi:hypothetical protein